MVFRSDYYSPHNIKYVQNGISVLHLIISGLPCFIGSREEDVVGIVHPKYFGNGTVFPSESFPSK